MNYKRLAKLIEKKEVNKKELESIEMCEVVENCTYVGLENGHGGDYLYHVKIKNDNTIYSITTKEI